MLSALLSRFRAKPRLPQTPPTALPPRTTAPSRAAPAVRAPLPQPAAAALDGSGAVGVGARRPLVSAQGRLAGFEFQVGPAMFNRPPGPAVAACTANLLGAMRLCCSQGLGALAELPAGWLAQVQDKDFARGMHLLLRADALCDDSATLCALVLRLRRAGVRVGWNPLPTPAAAGMPPEAGRPDFLPVPPPATSEAAAWQQAVRQTVARWPQVPLLLLELPAVEVMEELLAPQVLWAACSLGACSEAPRAQALPPQAQRALRLLNRLLHDDDHAAVVDDIKADAALSLRLLQYLNSAGALPGRELDSIEQAVLLLGRDALYRWVAQMLVRMSPPRPAAHALQATALARARLFELLARASEAPRPGALYLLGLATMLPTLLHCGIDDAAAALHLPAHAVQALRQQGGPWMPYLDLLQALEAADMPRIEAAAAAFGGPEPVLALWAEAWRGV